MPLDQINTTELDFNQIKQNLIDYFKRDDSEFKDWDYEGSGLSMLLDVLAYNTHYNAMLAHVNMNESFLHSAQLRENVVSRARMIGYVPRSKRGATARISMTCPRNPNSTSELFAIPKGTTFSAEVDGNTYIFQAEVKNGVYDPSADAFLFEFDESIPGSGLELYQGLYKSISGFVDNSVNQKFIIPEDSCDTDRLSVTVFNNPESDQGEVYELYSDYNGNVSGDSLIYFLNENTEGNYEVTFGDGTFGKKPPAAAKVLLEYYVSEGDLANGAGGTASSAQFVGPSWPASSNVKNSIVTSGVQFSVVSRAAGGAQRESTASIRKNAPVYFSTQRRAVTVADYYALLPEIGIPIDVMAVWGGEDIWTEGNDEVLGNVYIVIVPVGESNVLTAAQKDEVVEFFTTGKTARGILGTKPVVVDAEITYIRFDVEFKYDPALLSVPIGEVEGRIRDTIQLYNDQNLKSFDAVFRHSKFLTAIDAVDNAILNSTARIKVRKQMKIDNTTPVVDFGFELDDSVEYGAPVVWSDAFVIVDDDSPGVADVTYYIRDLEDDDSPGIDTRPLYLMELGSTTPVTTSGDNVIGSVDVSTGLITVDALPPEFTPDDVTQLFFNSVPNSNDIAASRAKLIQINASDGETTITGDIDYAGSANYTTFDREG